MTAINEYAGLPIAWSQVEEDLFEDGSQGVVDCVREAKELIRNSCPNELGRLCHLKANVDRQACIGKHVCLAETTRVDGNKRSTQPTVVPCSGPENARQIFDNLLANAACDK